MTDLATQYERQERWRRWEDALAQVPLQPGQTVLDLGCGAGQVARRLHERGARVIGVDGDAALLERARASAPGVRFEQLDLRELAPGTFEPADGIWSSFVAAYLGDLPRVLRGWRDCLRPGGWLALIEVDDLFAHGPLASDLQERIAAFYAASRRAGGYDFQCGRHLAESARQAGFEVVLEKDLQDDELSFDGPAPPEVVEAWRQRLQRMAGAKAFFGHRFPDFARRFVETLQSPRHVCGARVVLVVARAPAPAGA